MTLLACGRLWATVGAKVTSSPPNAKSSRCATYDFFVGRGRALVHDEYAQSLELLNGISSFGTSTVDRVRALTLTNRVESRLDVCRVLPGGQQLVFDLRLDNIDAPAPAPLGAPPPACATATFGDTSDEEIVVDHAKHSTVTRDASTFTSADHHMLGLLGLRASDVAGELIVAETAAASSPDDDDEGYAETAEVWHDELEPPDVPTACGPKVAFPGRPHDLRTILVWGRSPRLFTAVDIMEGLSYLSVRFTNGYTTFMGDRNLGKIYPHLGKCMRAICSMHKPFASASSSSKAAPEVRCRCVLPLRYFVTTAEMEVAVSTLLMWLVAGTTMTAEEHVRLGEQLQAETHAKKS